MAMLHVRCITLEPAPGSGSLLVRLPPAPPPMAHRRAQGLHTEEPRAITTSDRKQQACFAESEMWQRAGKACM